MRPGARWPRRLLFLASGLAAGSALALYLAVRAQEPAARAPRLPLSAAVQVSFDARAIPTARAASFADALTVQGTLHARERFFQMELSRRAARGELAELLGAGALPVDRLHRTYGFRQVAEAAAERLVPEQRALLEAYVAGVNAWLQARPRRLGLELAILRHDPRPWTAADSLAVLLLMHEDLSTSWRTELRAETLRVIESFGAGPGHVFNLGHGITPDVDPEKVAVLVDTVRNYVIGRTGAVG